MSWKTIIQWEALEKCLCVIVADEKAKAAVAKYAKNFLPRLFNLIAPVDTEGTDACRLAALETLKCYLKICDRQVPAYQARAHTYARFLKPGVTQG